MKHPLRATFVVAALMAAAPATADIIQASPSDQNGTTVHNGGAIDGGATVTGELGQNSGIDVLFTGIGDVIAVRVDRLLNCITLPGERPRRLVELERGRSDLGGVGVRFGDRDVRILGRIGLLLLLTSRKGRDSGNQ